MYHVLNITDMTRAQNFEVKFDKSDRVGILTLRNYEEAGLLTYIIIILVFGSFTIYNDAS
jgi:hypothetical protein